MDITIYKTLIAQTANRIALYQSGGIDLSTLKSALCSILEKCPSFYYLSDESEWVQVPSYAYDYNLDFLKNWINNECRFDKHDLDTGILRVLFGDIYDYITFPL